MAWAIFRPDAGPTRIVSCAYTVLSESVVASEIGMKPAYDGVSLRTTQGGLFGPSEMICGCELKFVDGWIPFSTAPASTNGLKDETGGRAASVWSPERCL